MSNPLSQYDITTADWRKTLRQNNRRTFFVIFVFFFIYAMIGILVDMFVVSGIYPNATLPQLFFILITFKVFPLATTVMLTIAAISLYISYYFYDKLMLLGTDYREITPDTAKNTQEAQLYNVVEEMKIAASLKFMPRVFIINADYMNAFASGYSEKSAMVAITRGLMEKLNRDELQAVMAHELSHVKHLDIKLTLTASLLANLTIMVLDLFFYSTLRRGRRSDSRSGDILATIIFLLRFILPIVSVLLLLYLSRTRELMADAGCVSLMRDNQPLASALLKIQDDTNAHQEKYAAAYANTPHENVRRESYIYDPTMAGISNMSLNSLFSTHPSLEARLAALGFRQKKL